MKITIDKNYTMTESFALGGYTWTKVENGKFETTATEGALKILKAEYPAEVFTTEEKVVVKKVTKKKAK